MWNARSLALETPTTTSPTCGETRPPMANGWLPRDHEVHATNKVRAHRAFRPPELLRASRGLRREVTHHHERPRHVPSLWRPLTHLENENKAPAAALEGRSSGDTQEPARRGHLTPRRCRRCSIASCTTPICSRADHGAGERSYEATCRTDQSRSTGTSAWSNWPVVTRPRRAGCDLSPEARRSGAIQALLSSSRNALKILPMSGV